MAKSRTEKLSLETSGWYLQGEDTFFSWVAAVVALPLWALASYTDSPALLVLALIIVGMGVLAGPLVGPPTTAGAHATDEVISYSTGRLRSRGIEVPLSSIVNVWVDPRPLLLPDIGNITVQLGAQEYLHFPGVRHAEVVREELLARRDRAVARRDHRHLQGAQGNPRRITMQ